MHTGQFRSLDDVVIFFNNGGDPNGFAGHSENVARHLSATERSQLVAFLKSLDGPGPEASLLVPPTLPVDPAQWDARAGSSRDDRVRRDVHLARSVLIQIPNHPRWHARYERVLRYVVGDD